MNSTTASAGADERALTASINLYYDLHVPGDGVRPLLIALHGYGANKRQMMREAQQIAPPNFAIASLQGFHQHIRDPKEAGGPLRFGFGWLTNFRPEESVAIHHRALLDLIETLVKDRIADPEQIFLLGFSQTCALNFRFAFTNSSVLRGVVGICGGMPGDWETNSGYSKTEAAILYLHGESDEFYPPSRVADYQTQLQTRASDVEVKSYQAGHEIIPAMRDDVRKWLETRATFDSGLV
jgi:phospholipase/carboxylesterase